MINMFGMIKKSRMGYPNMFNVDTRTKPSQISNSPQKESDLLS